MKSQSFDDWLLSDEPLNPEQEQRLMDVINSSPKGETLSPMVQSIKELEFTIRSTPQAAPAPGFTQRWQSRLAEKKVRQQRLMIGLGAAGALGTAIVISLAIVTPQLDSLSIAKMANTLIYNLILFTTKVHEAQSLAFFILSDLPPSVPIALWVLIATSLGMFALGWVYTMWRIIVPKGIKG